MALEVGGGWGSAPMGSAPRAGCSAGVVSRGGSVLPDPVCPVPVKDGVPGDRHQAVREGLSNQHPVERIPVRPWETPGKRRVLDANGKLPEPLSGNGTSHIERGQLGKGQPPEAVLCGHFPGRGGAYEYLVRFVGDMSVGLFG